MCDLCSHVAERPCARLPSEGELAIPKRMLVRTSQPGRNLLLFVAPDSETLQKLFQHSWLAVTSQTRVEELLAMLYLLRIQMHSLIIRIAPIQLRPRGRKCTVHGAPEHSTYGVRPSSSSDSPYVDVVCWASKYIPRPKSLGPDTKPQALSL